MLWLPLTLISAFCLATSDALTKKALAGHNEYLVTWLRILPGLPLFLLPLPFIPVPPLGPEFYLCVSASLPLEILALFLYSKALKLSPLNLTLPLLSLTPLLLLVVPFLLLGERLTMCGAAGVVLVALGGYLLPVSRGQGGLLAPLRGLFNETGSLCMIAVASIYSVTSALGKRAITLSSPLFFAAIYIPLMVLLTAPVALYKGKRELRSITRNGILQASALPALFYALQVVAHVYAINTTNVAYMIAVKRLSLLFGVLYGRYLFRERGGVLACGIMLAGVFLIMIGQ
ncbi:EamA family transporter [Geomonas sp.]|uniref:EamA family transporter n=1 Tax=Geomonas sp. TaxID=2651584 RepID=UPI002B4637EF|nr:EamA family transporter [Geomonas sp.]HJV36970.1 EamA family transporter [Geomonas sp.]